MVHTHTFFSVLDIIFKTFKLSKFVQTSQKKSFLEKASSHESNIDTNSDSADQA